MTFYIFFLSMLMIMIHALDPNNLIVDVPNSFGSSSFDILSKVFDVNVESLREEITSTIKHRASDKEFLRYQKQTIRDNNLEDYKPIKTRSQLVAYYNNPSFKGDSTILSILTKNRGIDIFIVDESGSVSKVSKGFKLKGRSLVLVKDANGFKVTFPELGRYFTPSDLKQFIRNPNFSNSFLKPSVVLTDAKGRLFMTPTKSYQSRYTKMKAGIRDRFSRGRYQDPVSEFPPDSKAMDASSSLMDTNEPEFFDASSEFADETHGEVHGSTGLDAVNTNGNPTSVDGRTPTRMEGAKAYGKKAINPDWWHYINGRITRI